MQQALADCRSQNDRTGEGHILAALGYIYIARQDYHAAIDVFQQQLLIATDADAQIRALDSLGQGYLAVGDHARALDTHTHALQLASAEDVPWRASLFLSLGWTYLDLKDYAQAIAVLQSGMDTRPRTRLAGAQLSSSLGFA
jgi:tetratricopeptide (TPR) repeat protein